MAGSSSEMEQYPKRSKKDDTNALTSGATLLWQLPFKRLQEMIECVNEKMDAIATVDIANDKELLCRLIWCLAGIKSNVVLSSLRATSYQHLNQKIKTASDRFRGEISEARYSRIIASLSPLTPHAIINMSNALSFDAQWLEKISKSKTMSKSPESQ